MNRMTGLGACGAGGLALAMALAVGSHPAGAAQAKAKAKAAHRPAASAKQGFDMTGTWQMEGKYYAANATPVAQRITKTADGGPVPLQAWAQKIYDKNIETEGKGIALVANQARCLPHGMPQMLYAAPAPIDVMQTPNEIGFIHELGRHVRVVYLNEPHEKDPDPTYFGNSIGHWEGDTLVIDTVGISHKTELDRLLMPHSDKLHVVERIRMPDHNHLQFELTIDDPDTFTRPWKKTFIWDRQKPGTHIIEYICADGNENWPDAQGRMTFPGANIASEAGATADKPK